MNPSEEVLLKLIRIALGSEMDFSLPNAVDWGDVADMSFQQGVAAIAIDGLQRISSEKPGKLCQLDEPVKLNWFAATIAAEKTYMKHLSTIKQLAGIYTRENVRMMVMKGWGLSLNYPVPSHRVCGDIDIFLFKDGLRGNAIIEEIGVNVDTNSSLKHSIFVMNGITIENHLSIFDEAEGGILEKSEKVIMNILSNESNICINDLFWIPSSLFNYIFLLRHMSYHFRNHKSIILRHLLDWTLFLKSSHNSLDVKKAHSYVKDIGLESMNNIFTQLSMDIFNIDLNNYIIPNISVSTDFQEKVLHDITKQRLIIHRNAIVRAYQKNGRAWAQKWKYKYLPESFWSVLFQEYVSKIKQGGSIIKSNARKLIYEII